MTRVLMFLAVTTAVLLVAGFQKKPAAPATYASVEPIFKRNCVVCHKGPRPAHGLDLTTRAKILRGDGKGKVVIPGKPTASRLVTVLHGKPQLMPPGGELKPSDVKKIEAWVRSGAK